MGDKSPKDKAKNKNQKSTDSRKVKTIRECGNRPYKLFRK